MKLICKPGCNTPTYNLKGKGGTVFTAILVLLMPKCAFCWAAYMQVLSTVFMINIPYKPWFLPLSIILFMLMLIKLLYHAVHEHNFILFILALVGGLFMALDKILVLLGNGLKYLSVAMLMSALMMDNVKNIFHVIKYNNRTSSS